MRTKIVVDDDLMTEALRATGAKSKRDVVEQALRLLLHIKRQEQIRGWRGRLPWDGDLHGSRRN
tara:strand:+ start:44 stop:235 length:192 start_codon:yes stop_codon:yes gene_type:complete